MATTTPREPQPGWEMFCEHANEAPRICPCPETCGCRQGMCSTKHTCIRDDGGTPNRRCDACDNERQAQREALGGELWYQRGRARLANGRVMTGSDLHLLEMALAEVDRLRNEVGSARAAGRTDALRQLAGVMRKVLAPESVQSLVDVLQVALLQDQAERP